MVNKVYLFGILVVMSQACLAQHVHERGATQSHELRHDPEAAHPEFPIELSVSAAWESHYVLEGRDSLDGDGITAIEASASYQDFTLGAWGTESPNVDYREYNYWIEYAYEWEQFSVAVSYAYFDFETDGGDDHEFALWLTYELPEDFELSVGGYYSDGSEGTFFEATLSKTIECNESLSIAPFASLGYNDGYVVDGHDGFNHFAVGVELSYAICEHWSLGAYIAGTAEIDSDKNRYADDELLQDFVYGGVSLSFDY